MKLDRFSNADFIGMEMVPLIFDSRQTFSELTASSGGTRFESNPGPSFKYRRPQTHSSKDT